MSTIYLKAALHALDGRRFTVACTMLRLALAACNRERNPGRRVMIFTALNYARQCRQGQPGV